VSISDQELEHRLRDQRTRVDYVAPPANDLADNALPVFLYDGVHPKPYFDLDGSGALRLHDAQLRLAPAARAALWLSEHSVAFNLISPGQTYGETTNQMDVRLSKLFRFGGTTRTMLNLDIYNLFNSNQVLLVNNNYAAWQVPQRILEARLFKISVQFDF